MDYDNFLSCFSIISSHNNLKEIWALAGSNVLIIPRKSALYKSLRTRLWSYTTLYQKKPKSWQLSFWCVIFRHVVYDFAMQIGKDKNKGAEAITKYIFTMPNIKMYLLRGLGGNTGSFSFFLSYISAGDHMTLFYRTS